MPFYLFDWTPGNIDHLAQHDVNPDEFEEVVCNTEEIVESRSTGNPIVFGWTSTGRYLCCVFRFQDDGITVEPVSAYEVEY